MVELGRPRCGTTTRREPSVGRPRSAPARASSWTTRWISGGCAVLSSTVKRLAIERWRRPPPTDCASSTEPSGDTPTLGPVLRRHRAVAALVAWTLVVWATRITNVWGDADLDTGQKWVRTLLALSFTVLALAAGAAVVAWHRHRQGATALRVGVGALAAWTVAVWVVRAVGILAADHGVGFKAVHTLLAVAPILLATPAWRETQRATQPQVRREAITADMQDSRQ